VPSGSGSSPSYLARLVLGILVPDGSDRFSPGDVRRVLLARSLEHAGISLEGLTIDSPLSLSSLLS
jgi:hypothetical protein